jgi:hypothetical protein
VIETAPAALGTRRANVGARPVFSAPELRLPRAAAGDSIVLFLSHSYAVDGAMPNRAAA